MREIAPIVEKMRERQRLEKELAGARELLDTLPPADELRAVAQPEFDALRARRPAVEEELRLLLLPKDPNDSKNVVLEIRAGTGGDEAALFAEELFRMYVRYAEGRGWKVEVIDRSDSGGVGGIKEVQAIIEGEGAYSRLKYEGGVHRVQRVPATETQGGSTPRRRPSRSCPRPRTSTSSSTTRTSAWTSSAPRARAGRASTRRTPPSG